MYSLRNALNSDLDYLKEYKLASILDYANNISEREKTDIKTYVENSIINDLSKYQIILYNNKDVGCLLVYQYNDGYLINEIYIDKKYQNNGIGTQILNDLMAKYNKLYLWVYKDNKIALKLYSKLGFNVKDETESRYFMEYNK